MLNGGNTDTTNQNHEIITSSIIVDAHLPPNINNGSNESNGSGAAAVSFPPMQPSTHNTSQSNQNSQYQRGNGNNNPSTTRVSAGEKQTQISQEMDVEMALGGRDATPTRKKTKEESGVVGVASGVTPQPSGKNQSTRSRGRGFFSSNRLSSAKLNRSEKIAEANRRDNSTGRIQSEGTLLLLLLLLLLLYPTVIPNPTEPYTIP